MKTNLYFILINFFILSACVNPNDLNKRFSLECEQAGFNKGSNVYKLCLENKKDIYQIDQANSLRNLNATNTTLTGTAGNSVSFSATFRLN